MLFVVELNSVSPISHSFFLQCDDQVSIASMDDIWIGLAQLYQHGKRSPATSIVAPAIVVVATTMSFLAQSHPLLCTSFETRSKVTPPLQLRYTLVQIATTVTIAITTNRQLLLLLLLLLLPLCCCYYFCYYYYTATTTILLLLLLSPPPPPPPLHNYYNYCYYYYLLLQQLLLWVERRRWRLPIF